MNVQESMRQARKAMNKALYAEACELYQQVLDTEEMAGNVDLQLRLGWCYERLEKMDEACALYEYVIDQYTHDGEKNAALELQKVVDAIQKSKVDSDIVEEAHDIASMDDGELMLQLQSMANIIELETGDVLCEVGGMPDTLWLLQQGSMAVRVDGYDEDDPDVLQARAGVLAMIGEIGIFTQQRRVAKVWATTPCYLYAISAKSIQDCNRMGFQAGMERLLREHWVNPVLSQHAIFECINDVDRQRLSQSLEVVELEAGACLVEAGEEHHGAYLMQIGCLFFLHHSESKQTHHEDESLLNSVVPGDMVHLGGLLADYKSEYKIVAATDVRLLRLSKDMFDAFSLSRPWVRQALSHYCSRPIHLQVMHPDDNYLWKINRYIELDRIFRDPK